MFYNGWSVFTARYGLNVFITETECVYCKSYKNHVTRKHLYVAAGGTHSYHCARCIPYLQKVTPVHKYLLVLRNYRHSESDLLASIFLRTPSKNYFKQDKQFTHNAKTRRVRVTTVTLEK